MSKVKCAAGLDSLNVRDMADVPEIDIDKMKDKELEVDLPVPKVYMLRKNYEKIDPTFIREQEKQHSCVIVPVDEAEMQRLREQTVVYTAPPPMQEIPDVFFQDLSHIDLSGTPGGNKPLKIRPKDYCKKKRAKRRAQKQARRKGRK